MEAAATKFDWTTKAAPPSGFAPKIPPGRHRVRVAKVMHVNKEGEPYADKHGNPSILVVFQDAQGREAMQACVLVDNDPATAWAIIGMWQSFEGMTTERLRKMADAGVKPSSFLDAEFAQKQLLAGGGRQLVIDVEHRANKSDPDRPYVNISFVDWTAAQAEKPAGGAGGDQIPF